MLKFRWVTLISCMALVMLIGVSCSNGGAVVPDSQNTLSPDIQAMRELDSTPRALLGYWAMIYDVEAHTLTPVPARTATLHLNVRDILEVPGPLVDLSINNLDDTTLPVVTVDVGLHHPFPLDEFRGFDVRGIFISRGNMSGWDDSSIRIPSQNEPRLTNADGYTRWWNPSEFEDGIAWFNYSDGLLGAPHWWANFNSVLNGYKLFASGLGVNDSLDTLNTTNRATFDPDSWNWRHYNIHFGKIVSNWVIFNYAVDASWEFPDGDAPWTFPDDYPINCNSPEAYRIRVAETNNTLFFDGYTGSGALGLDIDVFDWQNPGEVTAVQVEALDLWSGPNYAIVIPGSGGPTYSTYHIDIGGCTPTHAGKADVLISVPCYDANYQPAMTNWAGTGQYGAYQLYGATIGGSNCPPYSKVDNNGWQVDENTAPNSVSHRNCIWTDGMNVYIVWIDSRLGDPDVYFNKSADGGQTWLPADVRLSDDIATNRIQRFPEIAVTPDGQRICVLWDDQRYSPAGPNQDIDEPMYVISNNAGTTWTANMSAKLGGIPNQMQWQPAVCADDNGAFYMLWIDEDIGTSGDKVAMFAKVPAASDIVSLNTPVGDQVGANWFGKQDWKLDITYDNNTDTVYAVWSDHRNEYSGLNTGVDVFLDKSSDGGSTWGADVKVNPDNTDTDQINPCVAIGDSGAVYVVYIDEQAGGIELAFVRSYSGGAGFGDYQAIDTLPDIYAYPDMARGSLENLFVVWTKADTSYLTWSCDEGDNWEVPQMIDPVETPDEVNSPAVSVGTNQHVLVAASFRPGAALPRHIRCWRWQ